MSSTPAVVPGAAPALAKGGVGGFLLIIIVVMFIMISTIFRHIPPGDLRRCAGRPRGFSPMMWHCQGGCQGGQGGNGELGSMVVISGTYPLVMTVT